MGGGYAWHKSTCFTCKECNKRLDTTTLCERENEIYCKSKFIINLFFLNEKKHLKINYEIFKLFSHSIDCYAKLYGPKYYGHGHITAPIEAAATDSQPV